MYSDFIRRLRGGSTAKPQPNSDNEPFLPMKDEESTMERSSSSRSSHRWVIVALLGISSILTVAILSITSSQRLSQSCSYASTQPSKHGAQSPYNCGNSSQEAIDSNCIFDVMSFTWSRPECFDGELMADFIAYKNWTWWFDEAGQKPVPWDHVAAGHHSNLYVTWEYHLAHCTYMWKKLHRAVMAGRPLDSYIGSLHHTMHCEKMLLDHTRDLGDRNTIITIKFPDCTPAGRR